HEGARRSLQEALAIFRKALQPGDPRIAASLHNLGFLALESVGTTADARTNLREALAIQRSHILVLAGFQAEAEQLWAISEARNALSLYLSAVLAPGAEADASDVYDRTGGLKGLVTARQRWARDLRSAADPDTRRLLDELQTVNLRLLRVALGQERLAGEGIQEPTDPAAKLAQLDTDRRDLE